MSNTKKPVKRLGSKALCTGEADKNNLRVLTTVKTVDERELAELAPKRLFLFRPHVVSARFCYVPCRKVILKYDVSYFSAKRTDSGEITFVVDDKKGTGAIEDNIKLSLVKKSIEEKLIEEEFFTDEQATKKAIVDARWKVLMAKYKKPPELEVKSVSKFYRPYYEVMYSFGGKEKRAWIPADEYGTYFVYN